VSRSVHYEVASHRGAIYTLVRDLGIGSDAMFDGLNNTKRPCDIQFEGIREMIRRQPRLRP
jgi:hypothetical protein